MIPKTKDYSSIKLEESSIKHIKDTFSRYKYQEWPKDEYYLELDGRVCLHIYMTNDTGDDGFNDALFFDLVIFDCNNKVYYKLRRCDQIGFDNFRFVSSRIFKDGSTMYILDGKMKIDCTRAPTITKI